MDRDTALATLRAHEAELRRRGVSHAAIFGSVARGDATAASDLDILIDLDPTMSMDLFGYVAMTQYLGDLFDVPVDIANHRRLKPLVRPQAERDAIYAF
jgi:uncharacterized protein